jgi:regulatory protein
MQITSITQQVKQQHRYSIFVDGSYSFSLSDSALLTSKLAVGQAVDASALQGFKQASAEDKIYGLTLRYLARRLRSCYEIVGYLERKDSPAPLIEQITNKLTRLGLVDDTAFATAYVNDRTSLRPTSRRKMILELRKKGIASQVIEEVLGRTEGNDRSVLKTLVERKRRQLSYQDNTKLMQYLLRQGFDYEDVKAVVMLDGNDYD